MCYLSTYLPIYKQIYCISFRNKHFPVDQKNIEKHMFF